MKVVDFIVIVCSFTIILNVFAVVSDKDNTYSTVGMIFCAIALSGELIRERMKLKKIEEILNKVKEERGLSWDESF